MLKWWVGLGAGSFLLVGCGSSDVSPAQTPPEECEVFLDAYCGHIADCVAQNGGHAGFTAEMEKEMCVSNEKQDFSCGQAVAVGASFNECLTDVKQVDCSHYFSVPDHNDDAALPATCEHVIKILK